MAILDSQHELSAAQALSGAGAAASQNVIDLKVARRLFEGEPMVIQLTVDVAADLANGDETYQFDVEVDDNDSFSSATVLESRSIAKEDLTLGSRHTLAVHVEADVEQYMRLNVTLGGTTPSITYSAYLQPQSMVDKRRDYPIGYTIS